MGNGTPICHAPFKYFAVRFSFRKGAWLGRALSLPRSFALELTSGRSADKSLPRVDDPRYAGDPLSEVAQASWSLLLPISSVRLSLVACLWPPTQAPQHQHASSQTNLRLRHPESLFFFRSSLPSASLRRLQSSFFYIRLQHTSARVVI